MQRQGVDEASRLLDAGDCEAESDPNERVAETDESDLDSDSFAKMDEAAGRVEGNRSGERWPTALGHSTTGGANDGRGGSVELPVPVWSDVGLAGPTKRWK